MATGSFKLPIASGGSTPSGNTWVRPTDWLTMPTLGAQEVIGLMAVYDDGGNYVAVQCQGAYTVDWGDGTTTNYASNAIASYQHTFASLPSGTTTSKGFRQALVRITPQAGQNLTSVAFGVQNATLGKGFAPGWLEFDIRTPNCLPTFSGSSNIIRYGRLEKITIRQMSTTNPSNLFNNLYSLKSVYIEPTETNGCTAFNSMFFNCHALEEVNAFDTITGTNLSAMFDGCYNLVTSPLFNCSASTNVFGMFSNCLLLTDVPAFVMGTDCSQMFYNCISLENVGIMNTSNVTNFSNMFNTCRALKSIPLLDTSNGTNFSSMFASCNSLVEIPLFNTILATNMANMFTGSQSIIYLPTLNTANVTTVTQMFNNCYNLRELPALSLPVCTVFTNWLNNITTLSKSAVINATRGHSYSGMSLSQANIVTIFNNLGTASGAQTITVSSNPGYAGLTAAERLIATSKLWTIA